MSDSIKEKSPIFTIFLTVFIDLLGVTLIIPILAPLLLEPDGLLGPEVAYATRTQIYGFLVAIFSIFQFIGAPLLGSMSDKYGRRPILFITLFVSLAGYLIFALGIYLRSLEMLFIGRSIAGIGSSNISVIYSSIADISDADSKAKNFGLVGMAFGLGFVIGPVMGGIFSDSSIVSWFNFGTPFLLAAILVVINIVQAYFRFPETLKTPNPDVNLSFLGGWRNLIKAFSHPALRTIFTVIFLFTFGFSFFTQFIQVFLIKKFAFDQADIGYIFGYIGIIIALTQGGLLRLIAGKIKPKTLVAICLLALSGGFLSLLIPDTKLGIYLFMPSVAIFQGLTMPNLSALVSNTVPAHLQGETLGMQQSMQSLANTIPPIIGGFAVALALNFPILLAAGCTFLAWGVFMIGFIGLRKNAA